MVQEDIYVAVKVNKYNLLRRLKEDKKNIYLILYKVLEDIRIYQKRLEHYDKLEKDINEMKSIIDILLKEIPEIKNEEELKKEINMDIEEKVLNDNIEIVEEPEPKEEKKTKKKKKEETVNSSLDDISKELEELKEELKKLIEP
ncbi:hypothetical protein MJ1_0555 [Nanobdella aerobiophila]|uniref:Uncharacterized protein n=1 Tax=Nanobdella aerobiophila TaxID=2586965 RepID=A0A915SIK3_9ARCH|nr:hypothetical protein [Nanobdella aerobiophila]BBL45707.1 hypothetical protein MJ1_0555 [Nanobdella aerobiophila]